MKIRETIDNFSQQITEARRCLDRVNFALVGKTCVDIIARSAREVVNQVMDRKLSPREAAKLLRILKKRFAARNKHYKNPEEIDWEKVQMALENSPEKLWSLSEMERDGGEPDVMEYDEKTAEYIFYDCSAESPKSRWRCVYDDKAEADLHERCNGNAESMAASMGINILDEKEYQKLQSKGEFDKKTLNWLKSPVNKKTFDGGRVVHYARFGGREDTKINVLTDVTSNNDTDHISWGDLGGNGNGNPRERGFRGLLRVPTVVPMSK